MGGVAGLFMGKLSDMFGRKKMVLFSLFGTGVGFLMTGFAQDYAQLLTFRFITGLFGSSTSIAQAYVTDLIPKNNRPKYLAFIGGTVSLAFVIGPGIGSGFASFGIRIPFFVSSGLGFFGFIFAIIFLQESHPKFVKRGKNAKNSDDSSKDDENKSAKMPFQVWFMFFSNICSVIGWTVYTSMFALYAIELFNLNVLEVGYVTLVLAVVYVFSIVILFNILNRYIGVYLTSVVGLILTGISLEIIPIFNKSLWGTLAFIVFGIGLGNGLVMPSVSSMSANFTNIKNRGKILGLISFSQSIGMVIGPLLHGQLYQINIYYPMFIGGALSFIAVIFTIMVICTTNSSLNIRCCCCCICKHYKIESDVSNSVVVREFGDTWVYTPDKPSDDDYMKLGKTFGEMLIKKNYQWVGHYDKLIELLDDTFPALSTESLFDHLTDIQYLRAGLLDVNADFNHFKNPGYFS